LSQFKVYSSSAGSGKTYTLTRAYLKLVLSQPKPSYVRNILAITFTNDAANEMKSRILAALKDFGSDGFGESSKFWGMFREVADEIQVDEPIDDTVIQQRAAAVFHQIIHEYSDFSVKTIDSFVNQLVSAFTDDLNLPFNYEIVLDKDTVMLEAVERLFTKAGGAEHKDITRMLENFALDKAEDGKSWNTMPADLAAFSDDMLKDQYYQLVSKLNDLKIEDFREIHKKIRIFTKWFEQTIKEKAAETQRLIEEQGISILDFSYGKASGVASYIGGLQDDITKEYGSRIRAAVEQDKWFTKKTPAPIIERFESIKSQVISAVNELEELREEHSAKYTLLEILSGDMYKLALLKKVKEEFDAVLTENNQVYLAEFNRMILQIVLSEPVPFIYERLGEKFNHILIDEFQDTSDMQFYNLLPLIENALAGNHFNLVVGDAKQSIYRWRGGKMELIVHLFNRNLGKLLDNPLLSVFQVDQLMTANQFLDPVSLTTNYRSAFEIVEFNNNFFRQATDDNKNVFPLLAEAYQTFEQTARENAPTGGHVEVGIFPYEDNEELVLQEIIKTVRKSLDDGYDLRDIAILTRRVYHSSLIAQYLNDHNIRVISQDSLLLNHSGAIRLIVAFLRVIDQPDNQLAKYEAAYLFYQFRLRKIPDVVVNSLISAAVESTDANDFYNFFSERGFHFDAFKLQKSGLYAITEQIIRTLNLFEQTAELPYLFAFLDLTLDFGTKQSNHLHDFLIYWEEKKGKKSIATASDADAITITTIHRSKGLEYPIVIVPFANWPTGFRTGSRLWIDLEKVDYEELISGKNKEPLRLRAASVTVKSSLLNTGIAEQYQSEEEALFIENLNMLYVAFTRPTDKLYIYASRNHFKKTAGIAKLIENHLDAVGKSLNTPEEVERAVLYEGKTLKKATKKIEKPTIILPKVISEDRGDRLRLRRTSEKIFDPETLEKNKDRGNKVHAAFALIKSRNDISEAIRQLGFEGIINGVEGEEIKESIERVIDLPEMSPLFAEGVKVINEKDILMRGQDVLRPDRVVFTNEAVHVLDFKTGTPKESHKQQIKRYGKLYRQMGYDKVRTQLVYLENTEVVEVPE
jgi:ATP-dependent helicase/nuclease subunit A